jgi:hypothetical protein
MLILIMLNFIMLNGAATFLRQTPFRRTLFRRTLFRLINTWDRFWTSKKIGQILDYIVEWDILSTQTLS